MDANGQRFWMWSQPRDWTAVDGCHVSIVGHVPGDEAPTQPAPRPLLTLRAERPAPPRRPGVDLVAQAEMQLALLPLLIDRFGTYARWDGATQTLMGFGAFGGEVPRYATTAPGAPLDLALDADQVLLLAFADRIELVDLRDRFAVMRLDLPLLDGGERFVPHRLACDGRGGRWALDRTHRAIARIAGTPWPDRAAVAYDPGTFRPAPENPDAPRLELLPATVPADLRPIALAASAGGRVAVSAWGPDGRLSVMVLGTAGLTPPQRLAGADRAHALAWLDEAQVALRVADLDEVLVYDLDVAPGPEDAEGLLPVGRRYPGADAAPGGFVAGQRMSPALPPHLPLAAPVPVFPASPADPDPALRHSRALVPLAWRAFLGQGTAQGRVQDSGELDTCWHRLVLEAVIPPGCGVLAWLAAGDDTGAPDAADPGAWAPHWFGDAAAMPSLPAQTPRGHWLREPSELPHRAGLLGCPPQPQRVGAFSVLIQRTGRRLRALRGRRLWLRVQLFGNGRATPEVAALRAWGHRFSYVRRYLPELYRDEAVFDRHATGAATPHDFLERYVQLFEGWLTPLEDRIADAHVLTDPRSVPEAWLPWLAGWTGEQFPALLPAARRRDWLANAPALRRLRGTLAGLQLALDIATDGDVTRGAIVVVEDFRLRRTLATLLGIDLNRAEDPLMPGLIVSGNSFVGDTLILGDADDAQARAEFLALFGLHEAPRPSQAMAAPQGGESILGRPGDRLDTETDAELQTVAGVYERTAHRATVLVHEGLDDGLRALVAGIAQALAPAHVLLKVIAAREPFLVGVAALVGADTFLREPVRPQPARIDRSALGRGDRLIGGGAFDWRLEDGVPGGEADGTPRAVLDGPPEAGPTQPIVLDGRRSQPPAGGAIARWRFTRKPPLPP